MNDGSRSRDPGDEPAVRTSEGDAPEEVGIWASIREAVRGTERDLTSVSIGRAVLLLSVPTILEMSMESLLVLVDISFVSRLGSDAVATVGLTESMMSPMYALALGLSAAATATVARSAGEKDREGASIAAAQVIALAVVVASVLGVLGATMAPRLLDWMGASPHILAIGSRYTRVMLGGSVTVFLLFVVNAIFRSSGDTATAMRSLWLANILNMILAPCFIFGVGPIPRMGLAGASIATTASRGVGVVYQLVMLTGGRRRIAVERRHAVLRKQVIAVIVRLAAPATLQVLIETASWLALVRMVASFGANALAGYTIAMRIVIFALLPSWGLSGAAATLVGQNLGARKPERARVSIRRIAVYNVALLGSFGLVFAIAPHVIVRFFTRDPDTAPFAVDCLRIVAFGFVAFAYGMVANQAFNGAADTKTPMLVNLICFWAFKIPLAWTLSKVLGWGPRGVFVAITSAYIAQSILSNALLRRITQRWMSLTPVAPP